jgi:hypothetical protein
MEKRWPMMDFVYYGVKVKSKIVQNRQTQSSVQEINQRRKKETTNDNVDSFTWIMVAITSALDECLPLHEMQELLIRAFVEY